MSRVVRHATVNPPAESRVEKAHGWDPFKEAGQDPDEVTKRLSVDRLLMTMSCAFVAAALIVLAATPRSALGPTILLIGVVLGFGYAARKVHN